MSVILKWVSGGLEAFLGIPLLGGTIVLAFAYIPLVVALLIHIATLVFSVREGKAKGPSVLGIVTSIVAWIPFLGMVMHIITAVILMVTAYNEGMKDKLIK